MAEQRDPRAHADFQRQLSGPFGTDGIIRQAISRCWYTLPEDERTPERLEHEMLRIVRRALDDFKEDLAAFKF
jgi:hypothetical protein